MNDDEILHRFLETGWDSYNDVDGALERVLLDARRYQAMKQIFCQGAESELRAEAWAKYDKEADHWIAAQEKK